MKNLFDDLDRLMDEELLKPLQEGEFTVRILASRKGKTWGVMNDMVGRWIRDGKAEIVGFRSLNGKRTRAFRLVEKKRGG